MQVRTILLLLSVLIAATIGESAAGQTKPEDRSDEKRGPEPLGSQTHEYSPLTNAGFDLHDFRLPTLAGDNLELAGMAGRGKIVLIHFFATFCHNSNFDVATVEELYKTYHDRGLVVIGVSEYSSPAKLKEFIERHGLSYPVVLDGEGRREDRTKSLHYRYRTEAGDTREWGTPFSVIFESDVASPDGIVPENGIVSRRMKIAKGELIRTEVESFIKRSLSREQ